MGSYNSGSRLFDSTVTRNIGPRIEKSNVGTDIAINVDVAKRIPGLVFNLDASDVTSIKIANSSNAVSEWHDSSPSKIGFLYQGSTNARPTFVRNVIGTKGGILFNPANAQCLINVGISAANTPAVPLGFAPLTMFAVARSIGSPSDTTRVQYVFGVSAANLSFSYQLYFNGTSAGTPKSLNFTANNVLTPNSTRAWTDNETLLLTGRANSASSRETWINGTFSHNDTATRNATLTLSSMAVGISASTANNSQTGFNGYIFEVMLFDRALSDTERASVESHLITKWSVGA